MYDWANSAFITVIVASVFPPFFAGFASAGTESATATFRFSVATAIAVAAIAVLAPVLGTIADRAPVKKRFLAVFATIGVVATAAMFTIGRGDWLWAAALFVIANIGAMGSFVFYDALLPHIASKREIDRVSTAGYAIGYVGGGLLLAAVLVLTQNPTWIGMTSATEVVKVAFVAVALWWALFSLPLFRSVPEPFVETASCQAKASVKNAFARVAETYRDLRAYPQAGRFLLAFLIYNDGIGTIIKMAAIYGAELKLPSSTLYGAIVLVQFVGIPCTFAFGQIADRVGSKTAIYMALVIYGAVSVLGYFMTSSLHFYILAALIGMVQGGVQALSRSLFATLIPMRKAGEFFGLFAVFEKFAGIIGPTMFAVLIAAMGSSRGAILGILSFFVLGAILLARVDIRAGREAVSDTEDG